MARGWVCKLSGREYFEEKKKQLWWISEFLHPHPAFMYSFLINDQLHTENLKNVRMCEVEKKDCARRKKFLNACDGHFVLSKFGKLICQTDKGDG